MSTIKVNDINMYYEIHGEGFPYVMITGSPCDVNWWIPEQIEAPSKYFKTIIFDNRGSGRTDKPATDYSIKMFADDTVGLMNALNIEKAHVLGVSLGGFIAQEIAISYPERVEKLILCCTHCGGSKQVLPSNEIIQKMMIPRRMTSVELVNKTLSLCFTEDFFKNNPDFIESYKQRISKIPISLDSYQRQVKAEMGFNSGMRLRKIPNAKLVMLDNAGHFLFQPDPEKAINTINDFLTEKIVLKAQ